MLTSWDKRFLLLARMIGSWSKDPSTSQGAVIIDKRKRIISAGYNGFARGMNDDERLEDRSQKYPRVIHAEENAILFAEQDLRGYTIYVIPMPPCAGCAAKIIQVGMIRVVGIYPTKVQYERWGKEFEMTYSDLKEADVNLKLYLPEYLE